MDLAIDAEKSNFSFNRFSRDTLFPTLLVFVVYFLTAKLGLYLYYTFQTSPALIWPPVGIALAAVILGGYRMWVPIVAAQFLALVTRSPDVYGIALVISIAYALQAVVGLYVLKRLKFEQSFDKLRNTLLLVAVAFSVTLIEPIIATLAQAYWNILTVSPAVNLGRAWGAGVFSVLVLTPFIIMWYEQKKSAFTPTSFKESVELIAAFSSLMAVNYFLFWTPYPQYFGISVIFFLPALLIWFALRLHPRWLTLALVITSIQGIAGSIFAHPTAIPLNVQLLSDEVYIGLVAGIFLVFAAVVEERRSAYRELQAAYKTASAADSAKAEFIAVLAHELRNPLATLLSSAELLALHTPTQSESGEIVGIMHSRILTMGRLLDDLLDVARINRKEFAMRKERVELSGTVRHVLETVGHAIQKKDQTLSVSLPVGTVIMEGDPTRLEQALINIFYNAIKYTPEEGHIDLTAKYRNGMVNISVSDTGVGIPQPMLEKIFEPFIQVEKHIYTKTQGLGTGLGIGLSLTKNLVELHGGSVIAKRNESGQGSEFVVTLPATLEHTIPMPKKDLTPLSTVSKKKRVKNGLDILLVDDNEAIAKSFGKLLTLKGHNVSIATNGLDAINLKPKVKPHAILLDLGLGDMDGCDVAREIRKHNTESVLIALTGYGQQEDKERTRQAGFAYHVTKPVGISDIEAILEEISAN